MAVTAMADAKRWCRRVFVYLSLTVTSFVAVLFLLSAIDPAARMEEDTSGSREQRLYLLLLEAARTLSIDGQDAGFRYGMADGVRRSFSHFLDEIECSKDDVVRGSSAVNGAMSCFVNGQPIESVEYGRQ